MLRILDLSEQLREIPEGLGAGKGVMTERAKQGDQLWLD